MALSSGWALTLDYTANNRAFFMAQVKLNPNRIRKTIIDGMRDKNQLF
jgi:hypothetical protein